MQLLDPLSPNIRLINEQFRDFRWVDYRSPISDAAAKLRPQELPTLLKPFTHFLTASFFVELSLPILVIAKEYKITALCNITAKVHELFYEITTVLNA